MLNLPSSYYPWRHAVSVGLAVLIAVVVNQYSSFSQEYWIPLCAFLISQTSRGTPLRQGLQSFFAILLALFANAFVMMNFQDPIILFSYAIFFIIVGFFLSKKNLLLKPGFYPATCFLFVMFFGLFEPIKTTFFMHDRIIDAIIGSFIGLIVSRVVSYVGFANEFRQGLLPLLHALIPYAQQLTKAFHAQKENHEVLLHMKMAVYDSLESHQSVYPEWVYEVGFNPGLRAGFRYFLVNIERVVELFFAMNDLVAIRVHQPAHTSHLYDDFEQAAIVAMQKNEELLAIISRFLAENKLEKTDSDFTTDIATLETRFRELVPTKLELLDITPENLTLTGFVRAIKDMRGLLLQLIMALPVAEVDKK